MADQSIGALGEELMKREVQRDPEQFKQQPMQPRQTSSINPHTLATIGGLADAASTYLMLKRGGNEGNSMLGFTNNHPGMTALGALGGLAASKGVTALAKKFSPKLADALAANLGTLQTAYAVGNINSSHDSSRDYQNAMTNKVIQGK